MISNYKAWSKPSFIPDKSYLYCLSGAALLAHQLTAIHYFQAQGYLERLTFEFAGHILSPPHGSYMTPPNKSDAVPKNVHISKVEFETCRLKRKGNDYFLGTLTLYATELLKMLEITTDTGKKIVDN